MEGNYFSKHGDNRSKPIRLLRATVFQQGAFPLVLSRFTLEDSGAQREGDGPVAGEGQSWAETKPAGFRDPL